MVGPTRIEGMRRNLGVKEGTWNFGLKVWRGENNN